MKVRLWLKLFIQQFILLWAFILLVAGVVYYILPGVDWMLLLDYKFEDINIIRIILVLTIVIVGIYAFYLAHNITDSLELVEAKLNWLLLGKYKHPIFEQKTDKKSWITQSISLDRDIELIRQRLIQLSDDLQEFTAAPSFVSDTQTKEEIIEIERQRIARELHDSVSQQLFAASMLLSAVNEGQGDNMPQKAAKMLERVESAIGNAQTELRALLLHLRPVELEDKSLAEGIKGLINELDGKIPMELVANVQEVQIESGIEDHLFRVMQEALSNTLRHANASRLEVYLNQTTDQVQLKVSDNGVGFDVEEAFKPGNYGLNNIKERISSLGGNCKIISKPNEGTVITITVPIT